MMSRRTFVSTLGAAAAASRLGATPPSPSRVMVYASVGPDLTGYALDIESGALERRETTRLPANVQYAWPHASRRSLYVASSDGSPGVGGTAGSSHFASVLHIDEESGALASTGQPTALRSRPIHTTTDVPSEHLLIAYNRPSHLTVHRLREDGSIAEEIPQPGLVDAGIYGHQVRVAPSNRTVILVTRGNDAAGGKPEDPGALKVFRYRDGRLSQEVSIAPHRGYGFGPRHVDFHPTLPRLYASLERQDALWTFPFANGAVAAEPIYRASTLAEPGTVHPTQAAGTVHVHPGGRFVYGVNRNDGTVAYAGHAVWGGGENSIVCFSLDSLTGEPTPIQHIDSHGFIPRTFAIDPSGRILIAANQEPLAVREADTARTVPAGMALFRIGTDGRLTYLRHYPIDVGARSLFWMGIVALPPAREL